VSRKSNKSYLKVHADTHEDEALEAVAAIHNSRALAYWLVLMCESKKVHNTAEAWSGPWTLVSFAAAAYDDNTPRKKVRQLLEQLVSVGSLELRGDLAGRWRARPVNFMRIQERAQASERQTKRRDNMQDFSEVGHDSVTPLSRSGHATVTTPSRVRAQTETETDCVGTDEPPMTLLEHQAVAAAKRQHELDETFTPDYERAGGNPLPEVAQYSSEVSGERLDDSVSRPNGDSHHRPQEIGAGDAA